MSVTPPTVRLLRKGDLAWVAVSGRATLLHSPALRAFARHWLRDRGGTLLLDLSGCRHMDSTFIGTLLFLQRQLGDPGRGRLRVINPSEDCRRLLREMGVADLFEVEQGLALPEGEWTPLDPDTGGSSQVRACALEAHHTLASLAGMTGSVFARIAQCLPPLPSEGSEPPSGPSQSAQES